MKKEYIIGAAAFALVATGGFTGGVMWSASNVQTVKFETGGLIGASEEDGLRAKCSFEMTSASVLGEELADSVKEECGEFLDAR